jgi:hypothetical protein
MSLPELGPLVLLKRVRSLIVKSLNRIKSRIVRILVIVGVQLPLPLQHFVLMVAPFVDPSLVLLDFKSLVVVEPKHDVPHAFRFVVFVVEMR